MIRFIYFLIISLLFHNSYADIYNRKFSTDFDTSLRDSDKYYPFVDYISRNEMIYEDISYSARPNFTNPRVYAVNDSQIRFNVNKYISLNSRFILKPVSGGFFSPYGSIDNKDGTDEYGHFGREAITTDELSMVINQNRTTITIGKFAPKFGVGHDRYNPVFNNNWYGIWGTFLNDGYDSREKMGIKANIEAIKRKDFTLNIHAAAFRNDNSSLFNNTVFAKRQVSGFLTHSALQPLLSDNRIAGSGSGIKSNAVTIEGIKEGFFDGTLAFNFGHRRQFSSNDFDKSLLVSPFDVEDSIVYAGQYMRRISHDLKANIFGEYVNTQNALGVKNFNEKYQTIGANLNFVGWSISYIVNQYDGTGTNLPLSIGNISSRVKATELSVGYEFSQINTQILFGQRKMTINDQSSISVTGVSLRYVLDLLEE